MPFRLLNGTVEIDKYPLQRKKKGDEKRGCTRTHVLKRLNESIKRSDIEEMNPVKNVNDYIAQAPKEVQEKLQELRAVIKSTAPSAQERISYGMPYYDYKGRLVYFQLWKKHIGFYIPTPVLEEHTSELKGYETTKATVRFPLDEELPLDLIKKLVQARVRKNDEAAKKQ